LKGWEETTNWVVAFNTENNQVHSRVCTNNQSGGRDCGNNQSGGRDCGNNQSGGRDCGNNQSGGRDCGNNQSVGKACSLANQWIQKWEIKILVPQFFSCIGKLRVQKEFCIVEACTGPQRYSLTLPAT
jgi:hypothetical protein